MVQLLSDMAGHHGDGLVVPLYLVGHAGHAYVLSLKTIKQIFNNNFRGL